MKKKVAALLLAWIMCATCCVTATAEDETLRGPQYHYKTVYLDTEETSVSALAWGQDPEGAYFTQTTRIHYTLSGGTTVTGSVEVSLPAPYNFISFSVSSGQQTSGVSGYSVGLASGQAPGNYYLLITKYYYVNPYVVYRKRSGAADIPENWVIDHTGCTYQYRYHSGILITPSQAISLGLL